MRKCSIEGCEGKHFGRSYCNKHYKKMKRYGDPLYVFVKTEWKPVLGFEGYYEVSNKGDVKSLTNRKTMKNGVSKLFRGKVLSSYSDKDGYRCIDLYKDGVRSKKKIHRLVCESFIRPPLENEQVNHINGIKYDNNISNIEWVMPKENVKHSYYVLKNKGSKRSLSDEQVLEIRDIYKKGELSFQEIGNLFNVSKHIIYYLLKGVTYKNV